MSKRKTQGELAVLEIDQQILVLQKAREVLVKTAPKPRPAKVPRRAELPLADG